MAVSRIGSASDIVTRMVIRQWRIDPEKEIIILESRNTPTRMTALVAGHVDAALISPDNIAKILATAMPRARRPLGITFGLCPASAARSHVNGQD